MNLLHKTLLSLIVLGILSSSASAADNWITRHLWPFGKKKTSQTAQKQPYAQQSHSEKSAWDSMKMPQLWPAGSEKPASSQKKTTQRRSRKPSTMTRLTSSTKKMWDSTTEMILPDTKKPEKKPTENKPGFFSRMFSSPKPTQPKTVGEWLLKPRPQ